MIDLNSGFKSELDKLYGIDPIFVIEIDWSDDSGNIVSNRYSTEEFTSPIIYEYIKEFSNIEIVNHVEGLGQVNTISVVALDYFGHFKSRMDSKNIYHKNQQARVFITAATSNTTTATLSELFRGRIENIIWKEESKEVEFDIISEPLDIKLGFKPNLGMIDPDNNKLFKNYLNEQTWPRVYGSVKHFEAVPLVNVTDQIEIEDPGAENVDVSGENIDLPDIPVENGVANFIDLDVSEDYWIYKNDDLLDCTGLFTDIGEGDIVFRPTSITERLWNPEPNVVITLVPGSFSLFEFVSPPPIPLKDMVMRCIIEGAITHWLTVKVKEAGFVDGKYRVRINLLLFGLNSLTVMYAGKRDRNVLAGEAPFTWKNLITIDNKYKMFPKSEAIFQAYIIDTKEDVTINAVWVEEEEGLREITDYTVKNTTADGKFWNEASGFDPHPNCTWIELTQVGFFEFFTNFISNTDIKQGLLVDMTSTITLESNVLTDIIVTQAGQTININEITSNRNLNFVMEDEEDFIDFVTDIAWQGAKALRFHDGDIQIIDLINLPSMSLTIKDVHGVLNSMEYSFSPVEEVFTKFDISLETSDFRDELIEFTEIKNTDKYREQIHKIDFFIYSNRDDAQEVIDYWVDRLSEAYHEITFKATLEHLALEIWDTIIINLGNINFQDTNETPLLNVLSGSSKAWNGVATIKEIELIWEDLEVKIRARFGNRIGTI